MLKINPCQRLEWAILFKKEFSLSEQQGIIQQMFVFVLKARHKAPYT